MTSTMLRSRHTGRDRGAAMVMTLGIVAVITILAVSVASLSLNNLRNATRDKQSNSALATAEAGVAEAIEFIRSGRVGLSQLNCPEATPTVSACTSNPLPWANPTAPQQVRVDSGVGTCNPTETCYKVWIGTVTPYDPPGQPFGIYRIHSRGEFGNGPGVRNVVAEIRVEPYPFPIGVFAQSLRGNGAVAVRNESLFTIECISQRDTDNTDGSGGGGLRFNLSGVDLQYDRPPGAHTIDEIWTNTACGGNVSKRVHSAAAPCDPARPNDQSKHGGPLTMGDGCRRMWTSPASGKVYDYPTTSKYTIADLEAVGYRARGLSDDVYKALKSRAQASGTYWENSTSPPASVWSNLAALGGAQAVLYAKVSGEVRLSPGDIPTAYFRPTSGGPTCQPSNLVIVVEGGSLTFNTAGGVTGGGSGNGLVAALFVPDGQYTGGGNLPIIGSIFAKDMTVSGTQDFQLDQCFVDNPPSSLIDVKAQRFFEDDAL